MAADHYQSVVGPSLRFDRSDPMRPFSHQDAASVEISTAKPDLTICDREPITRLERIQSFGFLLAASRNWTITRASQNLESFLGISAERAIGMPMDDLINPHALHEIRNRMVILHLTRGTERLYGISLTDDRPAFDVAVHMVGKQCVLEAEPTGTDDRMDAATTVRAMIARMSALATPERFHSDAARQIQGMTGFDRVMIYQFEPSGNGKVVAEAVSSGTESFLGLHFPASDIPAQARTLYLKNAFRIIADIEAPTMQLLPVVSDPVEGLDLSLAITRAVSPVHVEYLRNMGVRASLSISIIVDGKLWGLIACHHRSARLPSFVVRTAAELFGQMYSMKLEGRLRQQTEAEETQARELADRMIDAINGDQDLLTRADWMQPTLAAMIDCQGIAIYIRGNLSLHALTPTPADIAIIVQRLNLSPANRIFATDNLAALIGQSLVGGQAAGLLAIPLSRTPRDYILLFRSERLHEIKWAGNPEKAVHPDADGARLSPRKSFAAFAESFRGRSRHFTQHELRKAEIIRVNLLDYILRAAGGTDDADKSAIARQEVTIAELNHRVRNVLSLIRGLISQTRGEAGNVESYVKSLDERVQALARAHNQLTRHTWGPAPLAAIFADEIAAYVATQAERFTVTGPQVFLQPQAFSTLALVVHELVTNSAKYGSLSDAGRVEVTVCHESGNGLFLTWRERGGPRVHAPLRRGFGSVLIERTIPFDLQGAATVRYAQEGLEADFFIPEIHIASDPTPIKLVIAPAPVSRDPSQQPLAGMRVLLLEDNLIVALEAEDLLLKLGARTVHLASNLASAAQLLAEEALDFAVLDINVGVETTLEFAERVRAAGIAFIFASGYGQETRLGDAHKSALVVSKPYDREALRMAITKAQIAQAA
jgi:light-regulated signal transduction histidine kinase (bacteriophytochrome)/CheY-like chemotaxis protein